MQLKIINNSVQISILRYLKKLILEIYAYKIMMWVWIIIAVIVIAGLLFWVKSGAKDNQADLSVSEETPEVSEESFDEAQDESADESFDEAQDKSADESFDGAQDEPAEESFDGAQDKPESFGTEESPSDEEKIA